MIVASSFIPFVAFAQVNFVRDLFVGITGSDVLDLQKILNSDSETKIADYGAGSSGNETNYFGNLTKTAVEKFQLKYSDYVLKPLGLVNPTGYVGFYTRDFLNKNFSNIANENNGEVKSSSSVVNANITSDITKTSLNTTNTNNIQQLVTLKSLSTENVIIGQSFEINGENFLKTSEVYLSSDGNENKIDSVEYIDSTKLKVTVSSKIKAGIYLIYVQNGVENDTRWISPLFILVSSKNIENISDSKIKDAFDLMQENNSKLINKIDQNSKIVSVENMINAVSEAKNESGQKGFVGLAVSVGSMFKDLFFNQAIAQSSGGSMGASQKDYWGGHISKVTYCTCYYSFGIILKIKEKSNDSSSGGAGGMGGGAVGGGSAGGAGGGSSGGSGGEDLKVVYQILISSLRANYNIFKAGANTIGGWTQTSFDCEDTSGYECTSSSSESDTITKRIDFLRGIGTSGANSDDYQGGGQ
jgi:hypothetical protein